MWEKSEIITRSPCKRKLQQKQEKATETKKTQIKLKQKKPKLKLKQPVQANKRKKTFVEKRK